VVEARRARMHGEVLADAANLVGTDQTLFPDVWAGLFSFFFGFFIFFPLPFISFSIFSFLFYFFIISNLNIF
jgi:hypothetical protein